jgi:hypothetical protein
MRLTGHLNPAVFELRVQPPLGTSQCRVSEAEAQSDARIDVVALDIAVGQSAIHFREQ